MNNIKKIVCFDFDGTLINSPTPETGREVWEKATSQSWAGRGWWGNPESLNLNVFYPPVNQWVYKHYIDHINDPECYTFLATGRLLKLKKQVEDVLKLHNIKFDDIFCNSGGETYKFKTWLFQSIIKQNPQANEFIMYDDRHEHLVKFVEWAKTQPIKVSIIDVTKKEKIF